MLMTLARLIKPVQRLKQRRRGIEGSIQVEGNGCTFFYFNNLLSFFMINMEWVLNL